MKMIVRVCAAHVFLKTGFVTMLLSCNIGLEATVVQNSSNFTYADEET